MSTIEVLQVQAELDWMTEMFIALAPKRVLEIGVYRGGTLNVWIEHAPPDAHFVAVDLDLQFVVDNSLGLHRLQTLRPVKGSSQDERVQSVIRANGPYDWAFVDGDHHLEAVESDVELALPLIRPGGVLVLHDIANLPHDGPGEVFTRLAGEYRTDSFIAITEVDAPHGVGVVHL